MFNGEKIILREYREEDLDKLLKIMNEVEYKRNVASRIPYPVTLKDVKEDFEKISGYKDYYDFAIESIDKGQYIGECGIKSVDWKNRKTEIYIFLGKDYLDKGYGTDAMEVLLNFIFNEMNLHKVKLTVFSFNTRAIRCYEKCGFKIEGTLRDELYKGGKYHHIIEMGILKDEYLDRCS
ncbi:GNAT family N-acetyltransferase [Dethiothermospora halolimnae]|uniref:GNAT family N-acetyltransferase n=1 Tax=Dethiothermospora halolimnae TaxID=3114390 RepID=UPI003CCC31CE